MVEPRRSGSNDAIATRHALSASERRTPRAPDRRRDRQARPLPPRKPRRAHHPLRLAPVPMPQRPQLAPRPYPTWIRNVGAKTVTRTLSPSQLERYRPLFDNTKRLRELTGELEALSAQVVEQAEGWTKPRTNRARLSGDGGDTAIDNVSTPRPETPRRLQRRHPNSGLR